MSISRRVAALLVGLLLVPATQASQQGWDAVEKLSRGSRVELTFAASEPVVEIVREDERSLRRLRSRTVVGKIASVEPDGLTLSPEPDGLESWSIARDQVLRIALAGDAGLDFNAGLLGAGLGAAVVGGFGAAVDWRMGFALPVGAALGFVAGALFSASEPEFDRIVYERPAEG